MVEAVPHRFGETSWITGPEPGVAMAQGETSPAFPLSTVLTWAGDFYHVDRLCRRLELARDTDLATAILTAYRRWGISFLNQLEGDFALVLWDGEAGRLVAARDPFGTRPLFYAHRHQSLHFASEAKQILLLPSFAPEIDVTSVAHHLARWRRNRHRTFFREIRRLPPGRVLTAEKGEVNVTKYWPRQGKEGPLVLSPHEVEDEFRRRLTRAVDGRLAVHSNPAVSLSGGLDSSSLAVVACREKGVLVSAIFPGLSCDETRYIDAVVAKTGWEGISVEPREMGGVDEWRRDLWELDSPWPDLQRGLAQALVREVSRRRGTALMTGLGGDEIFVDDQLAADFLRAGWFRWALVTARGWWWELARQVIRRWRRGRPRQREVAPWIRPSLREALAEVDEEEPARGGGTWTEKTMEGYLHHREVEWGLEVLEGRCARHQVAPVHPFLDREVAEFVLALPLSLRFPGSWDSKSLLRRSLGSRLPPSVLYRRDKVVFDEYEEREMEKVAPLALEGLDLQSPASQWIDIGQGRRMWEQIGRGEGVGNSVLRREAWNILNFQLWFDGLSRYNRSV